MRSRMFIMGLILGLSWLVTAAYMPAQAHMDDKSYFTINGQYTRTYPVAYTTTGDSTLSFPKDIAPGTYVIRTPIRMSIDLHEIEHVYPAVVSNTIFEWDMGDGTRGTGTSITHIYNKMGSYVINVYARSRANGGDRRFLESVMINVLPDPSYRITRQTIVIDGQTVTVAPDSDGEKQVLNVNMNDPVSMDIHTSGVATIRRVVWDLGDGSTTMAQHTSHMYKATHNTAYIIAHIEDSDGFITDTTGVIQHAPLAIKKPSYMGIGVIVLGLVGACIGLAGALTIWHHRRHSN